MIAKAKSLARTMGANYLYGLIMFTAGVALTALTFGLSVGVYIQMSGVCR